MFEILIQRKSVSQILYGQIKYNMEIADMLTTPKFVFMHLFFQNAKGKNEEEINRVYGSSVAAKNKILF